MELIAGEDLSQRIARGAILIDEALPIAKQIADAGVDRPAVENQRAARSLSTGRCAADPERSVNGKDACATTTCVGVRGQLSSAERPPRSGSPSRRLGQLWTSQQTGPPTPAFDGCPC